MKIMTSPKGQMTKDLQGDNMKTMNVFGNKEAVPQVDNCI